MRLSYYVVLLIFFIISFTASALEFDETDTISIGNVDYKFAKPMSFSKVKVSNDTLQLNDTTFTVDGENHITIIFLELTDSENFIFNYTSTPPCIINFIIDDNLFIRTDSGVVQKLSDEPVEDLNSTIVEKIIEPYDSLIPDLFLPMIIIVSGAGVIFTTLRHF